MDNQHQKIRGYRDLSQKEIDLMNAIKVKGEELQRLCDEISGHLTTQSDDVMSLSASDSMAGVNERMRIVGANPQHWLALAETDLQTGLMKLVRAVAQPTTF